MDSSILLLLILLIIFILYYSHNNVITPVKKIYYTNPQPIYINRYPTFHGGNRRRHRRHHNRIHDLPTMHIVPQQGIKGVPF